MAESLALAVEYLQRRRAATDPDFAQREDDRLACMEAGVEETAIDPGNTSVVHVDDWRRSERITGRRVHALGFPVAIPIGDDWPEIEDEDCDPHEAAVVSIQVAQLRRYLNEMDSETAEIMRMRWGVFGEAQHEQEDIAREFGLSVSQVKRRCQAGMAELRRRFAVEDEA